MTKNVLIVLVIVALAITGCTALYDMWPTKTPRDTTRYVGQDPNYAVDPVTGYPTLGRLKEIKEEVITKHIMTQMDYKHELEKDDVGYGRAIDRANFSIQQAEAERQNLVGTAQNPGLLLGALLATTGVGTYLIGTRKQRPEDYNEQEYEVAATKAVADALAVERGKQA